MSETLKTVESFFETFEAKSQTQNKALEAVGKWTASALRKESSGLILWSSNYGVGKTHLAKCAYDCLCWEMIIVTGKQVS